MKLDRFNAKVGSIDTDEKTACLKLGDYEWCDEYHYSAKIEQVLVESVLDDTEVNVLTEETEKAKKILDAEYAMEEED